MVWRETGLVTNPDDDGSLSAIGLSTLHVVRKSLHIKEVAMLEWIMLTVM